MSHNPLWQKTEPLDEGAESLCYCSFSNSFFFSSTLLSAFLVLAPVLIARAQHIPLACCHSGALNGSCFWSRNRMPVSEAFPLGSLNESWKRGGKYIYTYSRKELKRRVCFQSQDYVTLFALKHLRLIFQATIWGQSGWPKTASYHPFLLSCTRLYSPAVGHRWAF